MAERYVCRGTGNSRSPGIPLDKIRKKLRVGNVLEEMRRLR